MIRNRPESILAKYRDWWSTLVVMTNPDRYGDIPDCIYHPTQTGEGALRESESVCAWRSKELLTASGLESQEGQTYLSLIYYTMLGYEPGNSSDL